jgi:hypothetical protein
MQIDSIPVEQLRPAPYNPRRPLAPGDPGWEKLRRSLREFDLVQPIVWNRRTGHVVAGHQRLEILRHDGARQVDCVVVDLPLEREQALNVTLNNRSVGSDWDPHKLVGLLTELHDLPEFDPTLTGFDEQELRDLLFSPPGGTSGDCGVPGDPQGPEFVTATLEIPCTEWEDVRTRLDQLLAEHASVRLHVRRATGAT